MKRSPMLALAITAAGLATAADPPPTARFDLGALEAAPGQTGAVLPLSISFADARLSGWTAVLRADPAAVVISGVESIHPADYVRFDPPEAFVEPGTVHVNVIYDFNGETKMLTPASGGRVADLRVCVEPSASEGPHSVSILETAERATVDRPAASSYGFLAQGTYFGGTPVIGPPGTVTVRGPAVGDVACDVPSLPPGPQIQFHLSAPAAVSAGAELEAAVEVTTDTPLGGLSFALDLDEGVVQPVALTPATTWDAHSPFMLFGFSPAEGTVGFSMISDMDVIDGVDEITPGTHKLVDLRLGVLPSATGETTLDFADRVEIDGHGYENQATVNGSGADLDTEPLTVGVRSRKGAALAIVREAAFLRGDADGNDRVDIADAIAILGHLFGGLPALFCHDAADADDSGALDITDPLGVLGFLFLGRSEPPAPGPYTPGVDPTDDEISCVQGT